MDTVTIGLMGFAILFILILARVPVGAAMGLVGFAGFAWFAGFSHALNMLMTVPFASFASQAMSRWVFVFMLLGLCLANGMAFGLFAALSKWVGNGKTGSLLAALFICGLFGALAAFASIGLRYLTRMLWPNLQKRGCRPDLAVGVLAGGYSLGLLFPLAFTTLVFYAVIAEQNIGKMFLCSIPPVLISIILYITAVLVTQRITSTGKSPAKTGTPIKIATRMGVPGKSAGAPVKSASTQDFSAFKASWDIILLFVLLIGGPLSGALTPSESMSLALLLAVIFTTLRRRLNKKTYTAACQTALIGTGWMFMLLLGAMLFGYFLTLTRLPYALAEALAYSWNPYVALALILLVIVLLGSLLEAPMSVLLIIPIALPLAFRLDFHPIWFGIVALRCIGLGLMLPFGGLCLRTVQKVTGVEPRTAAKGVMPFVAADIVLLLLLLLMPELMFFGLLP